MTVGYEPVVTTAKEFSEFEEWTHGRRANLEIAEERDAMAHFTLSGVQGACSLRVNNWWCTREKDHLGKCLAADPDGFIFASWQAGEPDFL